MAFFKAKNILKSTLDIRECNDVEFIIIFLNKHDHLILKKRETIIIRLGLEKKLLE